MKKDKIIPKRKFNGLKKASDMFEPFDVIGYVSDPNVLNVEMLLIKFRKKPGKYDNPDGLGLCIYNTETEEFIEEPADLNEYNEGGITEDWLSKNYRLERGSGLSDSNSPYENIHIKKYDQFINESVDDKIELIKSKLYYWNKKINDKSPLRKKQMRMGDYLLQKYKMVDEILEEANKILNGFGVEPITDENAFVNKYYYDIIGLYVNMGDTYDKTIVFDTERQKFLITSWGDFYEKWQSENPVSSNDT